MAAFTVMTPPPSGDDLTDAERVAFIKDGFSWPALFVPVLWAIYHRLWLVLVLLIAAIVAIEALALGVDDRAGAVAAVAFSFLFALEANLLRRWTLRRRGWRMTGIVVGRNRDDNERRYFQRWLEERGRLVRPRRADETIRVTPAAEDEAVVGLFPRPEGA